MASDVEAVLTEFGREVDEGTVGQDQSRAAAAVDGPAGRLQAAVVDLERTAADRELQQAAAEPIVTAIDVDESGRVRSARLRKDV